MIINQSFNFLKVQHASTQHIYSHNPGGYNSEQRQALTVALMIVMMRGNLFLVEAVSSLFSVLSVLTCVACI